MESPLGPVKIWSLFMESDDFVLCLKLVGFDFVCPPLGYLYVTRDEAMIHDIFEGWIVPKNVIFSVWS